MVVVNKILNVLIFLLAIAACVAAVLLHQRRIELRGRADYLASVITNVAKKLDGDPQKNTSTDINAAQQITPDILTWQAYKAAGTEDGKHTAFETKVAQLEESTEKLFALKVTMAETFMSVKRDIKYEGGLSDEALLAALNSIDGFKQASEPVIKKITTVTDRSMILSERLVEISKAINKAQDASNFDIYTDKDTGNEELKSNLSQLTSEANKLLSRSQLLAKGYADAVKGFDPEGDKERFFSPEFNPQLLLSEDSNDIQSGVATLYKDLKKVNTMLFERAVALKKVDELRLQVSTLENVKEELNAENDKLKNENGRLQAEVKRVAKQLAILEEQIGTRNIMEAGFTAKVLETNDRFDFLILDKGKKQGVKHNVEMVIHSNGKYICKVVVTKVLENTSVCDILPVTRPKDTEGKFLMPISGDEAVVPGK
jgi:hypothetical protein